MRLLLCVILLFASGLHSNAQDRSLKEKLEKLKKDIRQSTYYDSSTVFKKGQEAIELATATASLKCTRVGGISTLPNYNEVKEFSNQLQPSKKI